MSGLLALRLARGGQKADVQELRALAFDNQTANFTVGLVVSGAGVKATGTLTLSGNAGNTQTVTIGTKVYTFQTVLTNVDGNVLIGATASDSIDNLIAAINLAAGAGTLYAAATTLHPTVTAAAGAGDTMTATAKTAGTAGNAIATTETLASGAWGAATLAGGIAISGARGTLIQQADAGATGTLQLANVIGEFTDNELITDSATGSALANGTLTTPLLTPDDAMILQIDAVDYTKAEALESLRQLESWILGMDWPAAA